MSHGALAFGMGSFSGGWILGNDDDSLLLLADNYNQQIRTEPQRRRDTETFWEQILAVSSVAIFAGRGPVAPGSPSTVPHPCPGSLGAAC